MRRLSVYDPLATRVLILRDGQPVGGELIQRRDREGGRPMAVVAIDHEPGTEPERIELPLDDVWVDERWLERWADAMQRYQLAEAIRRREADERQRCTCGHTRGRHHIGGQDRGCSDCPCPAYVDEVDALRRHLARLQATCERQARELEQLTAQLSRLREVTHA